MRSPKDDRPHPFLAHRVGPVTQRHDVASTTPARPADASEPLVDLGLMRDLWQYVLHACRRRKGVVVSVALAFIAAGVLSVVLLPRKYYAETKLLADRNVVMPLLGNPSRRLPNEADTPTRLAAELIMNRDNLLGIVAATDLVKEAELHRPLLGRAKRWVKAIVLKPLTPEEELEELVWTLRTSMHVNVGDGTVTIGATWSDPNLAYRIVLSAQQSFLEERQTQEIALIAGSISILEKAAGEIATDISQTFDSLSQQRAALTPRDSRALTSSRITRPNIELLAAQSKLDATTRSIDDLEQFRNRRLGELQSTLAEQRNTYGTAHPQVENTQQMIRSLSTDSPQLLQLRRDEQQQRAEVARLGGAEALTSPIANSDQLLAAAALRSLEGMRSDSIIQEKQQYGRSKLRIALTSYQGLLERLEDARMELQTVRATFQFKYGVLIPAAVPKKSISIHPAIVLVGALMLGAFMAVFTAVALDLTGGRVNEAWQIERTLGLPVLGQASVARLSR
jgi:uncharacterized protein involved in exopolysaccharide biosynthesis